MLQGLWAATLKSSGRSTSAVFLEAGFWVVAATGAGLVVLSGDRLPEGTISVILLAYASVLMAVTVIQFNRSRAGTIEISDIRHNLMLGLPLMITSILTVVISSSGRLVLGHASGVEAVGLYAVLYRSTTLPLVGHQIFLIALFRQIFSWSDDTLRVRAPMILLGVTGLVLGFWLLEPVLGFLLGRRFTEVFGGYRDAGLTLLLQTILWSAIALNDLVNSRLQIAGRVAIATAPVMMLGLGTLWFWTLLSADTLDIKALLNGFAIGHFLIVGVFYGVQCAASARLGHRLSRLWLTATACTVSTSILVFFGELIR